jgi:hypothetical protein
MALAALLGTANMRILIQGARRMPVEHRPMRLMLLAVVMLLPCLQASAEPPQPAPKRDGAHDFDFLIGDWKAHVKRLYNPDSHQWSIYLLDLDKGTLGTPAVVGEFTGPRGEFYDQEEWKGRAILVRYVWSDLSPKSARMEQSFSPDGGKTWEVNWICELSR